MASLSSPRRSSRSKPIAASLAFSCLVLGHHFFENDGLNAVRDECVFCVCVFVTHRLNDGLDDGAVNGLRDIFNHSVHAAAFVRHNAFGKNFGWSHSWGFLNGCSVHSSCAAVMHPVTGVVGMIYIPRVFIVRFVLTHFFFRGDVFTLFFVSSRFSSCKFFFLHSFSTFKDEPIDTPKNFLLGKKRHVMRNDEDSPLGEEKQNKTSFLLHA